MKCLSIFIIAITCFACIIIISCKQQTHHTPPEMPYVQQDSLYSGNKKNAVLITNTHDTSVFIQFQINNKFWFNKAQLLNEIKQMDGDSLPGVSKNAANAWRFVMQNSFHVAETPLPKSYRYSPAIFINSIGGGLCSNRNASLCHIWDKLGYKSRCIHLDGHLITEVFDNGNWRMLDADFHNYFLNDNNKVAGYKALEKNIDNMEYAYDPDFCNMQLFSFINDQTLYNTLYTTTDNNEIQNWYKHHIPWPDVYLELPPHASLTLPVENKQTKPDYSLALLNIPGNFFGTVNIPFAFFPDENTDIFGMYAYNNSFNKSKMYPPGKYTINGNNSNIYLYVNPLFCELGKENFIEIHKSINKNIDIRLTNTDYKKSPSILIRENYSQKSDNEHTILNWLKNNKNLKTDTIRIRNENEYVQALNWLYTQSHQKAMPDSISEKIDYTCQLIDSIDNQNEIYQLFDQHNAFVISALLIFNYKKEDIHDLFLFYLCMGSDKFC
ncbi:MAG: hypothetical protein ACQES1_09420 [Bacteroidota bacterium]